MTPPGPSYMVREHGVQPYGWGSPVTPIVARWFLLSLFEWEGPPGELIEVMKYSARN